MRENEIIPLCSCMSPVGTSRKIKAAVRKAVKKVADVPAEVPEKLYKFFSSKYGIGKGNILFANSLRELFCHIYSTFLPKRILVAAPAIQIFDAVSCRTGTNVHYLFPESEKEFDLPLAEIGLHLRDTDMLYLANPNRVTGKLVSPAVIDETVRLAGERGVAVVLDETLMEYVADGEKINTRFALENVITLRTTAFFYGLAGLELAYAWSSQETIERMKNRQCWTVNPLAAAAGITALKDKIYIKRVREFVLKEKKIFRKWTERREGFEFFDSDSNIIMIRHSFEDEIIIRALEKGGFSSGSVYEMKGVPKSALCISVMDHEHNFRLLKILTGLNKSL